MADTTKTYRLECPNPDCEEVFEVQLSLAALTDGGDCIVCPECGEEIEWEYDAASETLELIVEEDDEDEDSTPLTEDLAGDEDDDG